MSLDFLHLNIKMDCFFLQMRQPFFFKQRFGGKLYIQTAGFFFYYDRTQCPRRIYAFNRAYSYLYFLSGIVDGVERQSSNHNGPQNSAEHWVISQLLHYVIKHVVQEPPLKGNIDNKQQPSLRRQLFRSACTFNTLWFGPARPTPASSA